MDLWDNDMYTKCKILNESFTFLVDNGSTASLMSKRAYDQIDHLQKPKLIETQNKLKGADSKPIKLYGKLNVSIIFGRDQIHQQILVCGIESDGILV
ncbi:hypothetical protein DPMN_031344 [Dreissena polymorpha]|uniref:Peptidase A2 domain-containing protein n=1 Tax=Dreissena polymorpha TaxID=45954 RepID=A0A9D4M224_DREPO|nr:hypothetical protein DPMN_031344 [Dreissena polymorpha]